MKKIIFIFWVLTFFAPRALFADTNLFGISPKDITTPLSFASAALVIVSVMLFFLIRSLDKSDPEDKKLRHNLIYIFIVLIVFLVVSVFVLFVILPSLQQTKKENDGTNLSAFTPIVKLIATTPVSVENSQKVVRVHFRPSSSCTIESGCSGSCIIYVDGQKAGRFDDCGSTSVPIKPGNRIIQCKVTYTCGGSEMDGESPKTSFDVTDQSRFTIYANLNQQNRKFDVILHQD